MREFAAVIVAILVFCLFCAVISVPFMAMSYFACRSQANLAGVEWTWGPLVECQVKTADGYFMPYDHWRGMESIQLKRQH